MGLRLGIDLDGVVADFNSGWISRYNSEFGTDIPFDAVQSWDGITGLTHFRHMGEFWRWARDHDGHSMFRHFDAYPDAVPTLNRLVKGGHRVVILTSKPWWAVHDTFEWLAEHRLPTREVHMIDDKWQVGCDVYLEDAPHELEGLVKNRPDSTVCRFVRPWNDEVPGAKDVVSWDDFAILVKSR